MNTVFVSYSHRDSSFVDRLIRDLRYSDVPATYDKWVLRVGDSIIQRIAQAVADSDKVVAVLSQNSVKSSWVAKELSLAMTGEVNGRSVKVLPAVIDSCRTPPAIADKLYADFQNSYYYGLQGLLDAIDPRGEERRWGRYRRDGGDMLGAARTLEDALGGGTVEAIRDWSRTNTAAVLSLLGRRWALSEAIDNFKFGTRPENCHVFIANGQSFSFDFVAVRFGPPNLSGSSPDILRAEVAALRCFVDECLSDFDEFCRAASIRFSEDQIAPPSLVGYPARFGHRHRVSGTVLAGRRSDYANAQAAHREEIMATTDQVIEIASYDRLLDAIAAGAEHRR